MNKILALSFLILLSFCCKVLAWNDDVTHKDLSKYSAQTSSLRNCANETDVNCNILKKLGYPRGLEEGLQWNNAKKIIEEWLQTGADLEDSPMTRSLNHFHNPLKYWEQAGLNDMFTGQSSLLWSQDGVTQQDKMKEDWSWRNTRDSYYEALKAVNETDRQAKFAQMFLGLGHQIHLLQDTGVPDHVRNDAHPEDAIFGKLNINIYFESWVKTNLPSLTDMKTFAPTPAYPNLSLNPSDHSNLDPSFQSRGLSPSALFIDTDTYDGLNASAGINQGLSEYTNANFFSGDTIFAAEMYASYKTNGHYFPYPRRGSTDLQSFIDGTKLEETITAADGIQDTGVWISKTGDGEQVAHFTRPGLYTKLIYSLLGEGNDYYSSFYRDKNCHYDYAKALIPRAVGYSSALLDYFFRGTLEITAPDEYVYGVIDGSVIPQDFTKIKAKVFNTTLNETITTGSLHAVARYKVVPNYVFNLSNYPPDGAVMHDVAYSYSVSSKKELTAEELASINDHPTEFNFDFSNNPIPAGITDLALQVIFKGTLGNETDNAIAVGIKDLKEPAHHIFWNLSDMFSLDEHLYTAEHIRADSDLLERAGDAYIDPYVMNFEISYMSDSPPANSPMVSASGNSLPAGRYIRLIALVDDELTNNYVRLVFTNNIDTTAETVDFVFEGVVNQETEGVWQQPTPAIDFRRATGHFYVGILRCKPMSIDPVTGYSYCSYPESEAYPADLTPYPVVIDFP